MGVYDLVEEVIEKLDRIYREGFYDGCVVGFILGVTTTYIYFKGCKQQ